MNFGICDDNKIWLEELEAQLREYETNFGIDFHIAVFDEASVLLKQDDSFDCIFLDIELQEENGIEVAKKINEKWPACQIVFLTNYLHYATEVYEADHVYFVLKEQLSEKLETVLKKVLKKNTQNDDRIVFNRGNEGLLQLTAKEIYYFERNLRVTNLFSAQGKFVIKNTMKEVEEILSQKEFCRCHNSYLVNLEMILELGKDHIVLTNHKVLPISRSYRKKVQSAFAEWMVCQL